MCPLFFKINSSVFTFQSKIYDIERQWLLTLQKGKQPQVKCLPMQEHKASSEVPGQKVEPESELFSRPKYQLIRNREVRET